MRAILKNIRPSIIFLAALCFSLGAKAQSSVRGKTEVLILGTPHLTQIKDFRTDMLDTLLARLDILSFDAVCVENMPAELLYEIRSRQDSAFADVLTYFGGKRLLTADSIQQQLDIEFLEAQNRINKLNTKDSLSDSERVSLIEYSLAAADPLTAALHYQLIKDKEFIVNSRLPRQYFEKLSSQIENPNELNSIALKLAVRENLNKIEYIDNFQDEALLLKHYPAFIRDYNENKELFKEVASAAVFARSDEVLRRCLEKNDLLDYYRFVNSDEFMKGDFKAQWEIWLNSNFPSGSDRARYNLWEMRNLQIAANILKVSASYPGERIIVIIGASHKSFLEKYLSQIPSIELMPFTTTKG